MYKYLKRIGILILIPVILFLGLLFLKSSNLNLFNKHRRDFKEPIIAIADPIKNETFDGRLIIEKAGKISLKLWAECYVGNVDLSLSDVNNNVIFEKSGKKLDIERVVDFAKGVYHLRLKLNNVFPALAIMQVTTTEVQSAVYSFIPRMDNKLYIRVDPDIEKGFYWPYYLYIPKNLNDKKVRYLLVMPNNTGTVNDNLAVHENAAVRDLLGDGTYLADQLETPLLIPVFPRPQKYIKIYTHALDRDSLMTEIEGLKRLDRQLSAMIDDARERLKQKGISLNKKVLMAGFSGSGMFVNRFTILHPERIRAAAVGSPGGWPIVPVSDYKGQTLRYPIGVADIEKLTGRKFDIEAFKKIPIYFYIGSIDQNDSVPFFDSYDDQDRPIINNNFGKTPVKRWPSAEKIYQNNHCLAKFVIYPLVGHEITSTMKKDMIKFFQKNK
jgi:hypothetical protein